ncbi:carbohydrate kinase family protein [Streptomyces sp. H27-D2]|uniref:carbohydrate kinase family protein n=1 Tax=Streptomyces sp. H27-D2 TaxID=3046304 RepID=UPI002DB586C0|nr:carbohydrate kinase family protein [Streptomyces sp. H27-D2]MEC4020324.1 carbohydrate kinase family protein [Streptomyces sp. H27-D2]
MRIAVSGSIATDHLASFPGRFTEQLIADQLEKVSLSFLVDDLEVRRGGVAANISYGLGQLGLTPTLVGAVGEDFGDYRVWLEDHGVDTDSVWVSTERQTARFMCTTDQDQNQIASFYTGAMAEARDIDLRTVVERLGGLDLVVVSPNDPQAMLRHTAQCRELGIPFAADPSQQSARLERAEARRLVEGARWLFTNEYESAILLELTGWRHEDVLARVGTWIVTRGARGVVLNRADAPPVAVRAVDAGGVLEPTGVGDAFRAGFLAATAWGLPAEAAARLGCAVATTALAAVGPQEYDVRADALLARVEAAYGPAASQALLPRPTPRP